MSDTAGAQSSAARTSRWSNQCAVDNCSARKLVIGGSSVRSSRSQTRSTTSPPDLADPDRHVTPVPVDTGCRSDAVHQLVNRAWLSVGHDERPTAQRRCSLDGGDQGVGGVGDVRGVDQCGAGTDEREATVTCPVDDPTDELRVAGSPDEVGTDRDDGELRGGRLERCISASALLVA